MKVLLLAGEESGVLYARKIAAALSASVGDIEIRGYEDYGFSTGDLAVMGFGAVLRKLFYFLRVKRTMERAIREWRPDVVCTVDYPGMNLKLAAYAKLRGVYTVHVVCPQVWAWKAGRIPKIEASIDKLCCFFPFEPALFKPLFAEFVGHPLTAEFDSTSSRADRRGKTLALLPGSRVGEIERNLPVMLEAAGLLPENIAKDLSYVIPAANDAANGAIRKIISSARTRVEAKVQSGGARELLRSAECAVVASGTATLEAALARCPTVLVYKVGCHTDLELVEEERGRGVGLYLKKLGLVPTRILAAPLKRTLGTAALAAEAAGCTCPVEPDHRFIEVDYGPDENKTEEQVMARLGTEAAKAEGIDPATLTPEEIEAKGAAIIDKWNADATVPSGWKVDVQQIRDNWMSLASEVKDGEIMLCVSSNGTIRFAPVITGDYAGFCAEHDIKVATGGVCIFTSVDGSTWDCTEWGTKAFKKI